MTPSIGTEPRNARRAPAAARYCLLIACLLALAAGAEGATVALSINDTAAGPQSTVQVPIHAANAQSLGGLDLTVTYDPAVLTFEKASAGALAKGASVQAYEQPAGTVYVSWLDSAGATGSGDLVVLQFRVPGPAGSSSKVDLVARGAYGTNLVGVPVSASGGTVSVQQGAAGAPLGLGAVLGAIAAAGLLAARRAARR